MGVKELKNRKNVNLTLDKELLAFMDKYAKETGIPKTRLHDKAMELLKEKYDNNEKIF